MGIRKLNPVTPGTRHRSVHTFEEITSTTPEKSLLVPLRKSGGRNNYGRVTARHIGGGNKRHYRIIDFKRDKFDIDGVVKTIEYDPNRTCRIALVVYKDGEKRYILAPQGLKVGDVVKAGDNVEYKVGNATKLKNLPVGAVIHNVELKPKKGGQLGRSAGTSIQLVAKDQKYCQIKLPSGEVRMVLSECMATIGSLSNPEHENIRYGKAGRKRWLGIRPHVRGIAMNPIDHPNGGGEGKSKSGGGRQHLTSPWGQLAKGLKTRKRKKLSNKFIVKRRK